MNANKSEAAILLRDEMKTFREKNAKHFRIKHVLSHPSENLGGRKGHVYTELIKELGFELGEGSVALPCGSLEMIQKATLQALRAWGYVEEEN